MTRTGQWRLAAAALLSVIVSPFAHARMQDLSPRDWNDALKEEFLLNADIGIMREVSTGRNRTRRAELNDGVTQHDGHVQIVDLFMPRFESDQGVELSFTDSYKHNIAAYRLDRLLGLNMVPVSVARVVAGDRAALTWWVDDVQMMMLDFYEDELVPPSLLDWTNQMMHVRVFNQLVSNVDPNLGNFLITDDWKIWMVDFTRAFRIGETLRGPQNIENIRIDRRVFDGMRSLNFEMLRSVMDGLLTDTQIRALLARRDLIVQELEGQMARRGESGVLRD